MQRIPNVSRDDVLRVIRRDFPAADADEVLALLDRYGTESRELGRARVQLAVLKLAGGSVPEVARQVEAAKRDYRDVLAEAEYPENLTAVLRPGPVGVEEQRSMDDRDWEQYRIWLERR